MMRDDHYGWFERVSPGVYALTDAGRQGLAQYGPPPIAAPDLPAAGGVVMAERPGP
ncbi:MAG: hypothetical protein AcusKO_06730 [Acuticoccus sp.]